MNIHIMQGEKKMKYTTANVTIDIFCIIFLAILTGYCALSREKEKQLTRRFMWICVSNLGMLIGDLPNWLCEGYKYWWNPATLHLGIFLQFASGVAVPLAYTGYIKGYIEQKVKVNKTALKSIYGLGMIGAVIVLVNLWTGWIYYIDAGNVYHRGTLWIITQIIAIVILTIDTGIVIYNRKHMPHSTFCAFIIYVIAPLVAIVLQSYFYGVASTYGATTFAIFISYLNIQAEQALALEHERHQLAENKVRMMLSQVQPHFLFNTLTAIGDLCQSDPARAEKAIIKFSRFLRGNIDSLTAAQLIPFEKELDHTKYYLDLEKMRFGTDLKIAYEIESMEFMVPSLILQPIVENAVRYGASKKEEGGTVMIATTEDEKSHQIMVTDDGPGFDMNDLPKVPEDGREHVGIENIRERLRIQCHGELKIESHIGEGTKVTITIPKS